MKRFGNVYEVVCERENLRAAYFQARKGKRGVGEVIEFEANLGQNLAQLQRELLNETYRLGAYRVFFIKEPKERLVMAMPFRDRVVQHSLCDFVLEPILDRHLITANCDNRHGMGTHFALRLLKTQMMRISWEHPSDTLYCLKCDISKYFYSIDHQTLKQKLRRLIKAPKLLRLLDHIIDSGNNVAIQERTRLGIPCRGVGLPIGNQLASFLLFITCPIWII